jgi:7-carboxy-7-deazaguanine synthase
MSPASGRATMPAAIELGHRDTPPGQGGADVAVEPAMRGEAVDHDQGQTPGAMRSVVLDVQGHPGAGNGGLDIRFRLDQHRGGNTMDSLPRANHSPGPHPMRITEIYASIHGESQYAGLPCTLVRTTGCDLRCSYCDTTYAFAGGREMSVDDILAEVEHLALPFVLVTGGEPMLQPEIVELARRLLASGRQVAIETSGAHALDDLPAGVLRIVDVKTPSSRESDHVCWEVLASLGGRDAVKFVLSDEADYHWAVGQVARLGLTGRTEVLFSPVHGKLDPRELVAWIVRDRLPVRVNLQLHKYVWGPETRRV